MAFASAASAAAFARVTACSCRSFSSASSRRAISYGMCPSREPSTFVMMYPSLPLDGPTMAPFLAANTLSSASPARLAPPRAFQPESPPRALVAVSSDDCFASSLKVSAFLPLLLAPRLSFSASASAFSRAALSVFSSASWGTLTRI